MSQSVVRAAAIIDRVAAQPMTVAELAEVFSLHRSTMFRELRSLVEVGFLRRTGTGAYALGARLITLAQQALERIDLREIAHDYLRELHEKVGNTVHLAALIDDSIVYVDKMEDSSGVRLYSRIGRAVLPYCTGVGKVILAELDVKQRDALLEGVTWERFTEKTLATRTLLDAQLETIRAQGWGVDDGEFEDFVNCVAVPIRGSFGVVGAMSITAIRMVENLEQLRRHVPLMQETARRIAADIG